MIHRQRRGGRREVRERAQRHLLPAGRRARRSGSGSRDSARTPAPLPSPRDTGSASVYMVDTWRWPKASYSVLSISCGEMPKRAAVSRSYLHHGLQPVDSAGRCSRRRSAEPAAARRSIGRPNVIRSCRLSPLHRELILRGAACARRRAGPATACRYSVAPGTAASFGRSRAITSSP